MNESEDRIKKEIEKDILSGCYKRAVASAVLMVMGAFLAVEHIMTKWFLDDPWPIFPNHEYYGLFFFIAGFIIGVYNSKHKKILLKRLYG